MSRLLLSCVAAIALSTPAFAHHTASGRTHPTVQITQAVMAGGQLLQPGTYELWVTDEHPDVGAGAPSENQRVVEFARDGKVVAREIAEVFPVFPASTGGAVGTSGTAAKRARVEMLRGNEFLRVSFTDPDGRFLIHLPTGNGQAQ